MGGPPDTHAARRGLVAAAAACAAATPATGQPFVAYVAALTEDSVLRLTDLNGDGDYLDDAESAVFFGPGNASGLPGLGSAQCLLAIGPDHLLAGEGEDSGPYTPALIRLRDTNGDGDAMDPGEAAVVWNGVLPLPGGPGVDRMKEIIRRDDGSLLIADNNTINFGNDTPEAIWALDDANGDGDYNDGEAALFRQLAPAGEPFGFITEDFALADSGTIFFSNAESSTNPVELWTLSPDGSILTPYFDDGSLPGIALKPVGMTLSPAGGWPMMIAGDFTGAVGIVELRDLDGSGDIDPPEPPEFVTRYNSASSSTGIAPDFNNALDVAAAPDGSIWVIDAADNTIIRFEDLNGDQDFQDSVAGVHESAVIFGPAATGATTSFPRTVVFAAIPCPADVNGDGVLDGGDFFAWVAAFGAGDPAADLNMDGALDGGDFFAWVAAFGQGC